MQAGDAFILGFVAVALVVAMYLITRFVRAVKLWRYGSCDSGFASEPWKFDGKVISVTGSVQYVFKNSFFERFKRRATDKIRDWTGNDDSKGRYVHQRFLLKSPALKRGYCVLVEHNIDHGKVPIGKGKVVEVRGEYLHTVRDGSKHFYGRIHFTHKPKGHLRVV